MCERQRTRLSQPLRRASLLPHRGVPAYAQARRSVPPRRWLATSLATLRSTPNARLDAVAANFFRAVAIEKRVMFILT